MKRALYGSVAAIAVFSASSGWAQDAFDLGEIVLSGSLSPVEQGRTGATVEVVDGADIAERDGRVLDTLIRLPGVNSTSNGGLGALGTIQVRGLPARYVGVRINGINVSDPSGTQNQFNFGNFTGAGVGRVEVLKGSQSALYGSEAIAGVVDITTFTPETLGFSGQGQLEVGSFETYSGTLSLGVATERGEVAATFGYVESEGISARTSDDEKDGFRQRSLSFTASHDVTDALTLGGALLYRNSDIEIDRSTTDSSGLNSVEELGARLFARFATGAVTHTFSYSIFDIERNDPGGFTARFEGDRQTVSYLGNADLNARTSLNFGLDYTEEDIDTDSTSGSEETASAMAELLFAPSDQLDLSAALRYDDNSDFGGEVTGRLAAAWRPAPDWTIRTVVGTGYRAPSLFERFSSFGEPNLQPEKSRSFELGAERSFASGFVKATWFYTEIDDLIDFDGAAVACGSGFGCYNQVPGTTISQGIELSGETAVSDRVTVFGAYTYTDAETEGERLTRTPRHDLVIGAEADFSDRLSGYVDLRHVADIEPSAFAPADNLVDDYTLVGVGATYNVSDTAEVYLRVENLFDEQFETAGGFNQPGRAAFFGVRASF
ncbi:MAG: TonB-dependent receptor plug domain-containing protein [Paracoccaceae bacterium]